MRRVKISVTVDEDLVKWARRQVDGKKFRSLSHLVEVALYELRGRMKGGEAAT